MGFAVRGMPEDADYLGPTTALWAKIPVLDWMTIDPGAGYMLFEDFTGFGGVAPSAGGTTAGVISGRSGEWAYYVDTATTAGSIRGSLTVPPVLELATGARDNNEAWIQSGAMLNAPFCISDTAGADFDMVFEARFKITTVTGDDGAPFIGLAEEGLAAADTMVDDTAAFAAKDHLGFHVAHATPTALDWVYGKAATSTVKKAAIHTLVAATYVKAGWHYDARRHIITPWIDGSPDTDNKITAANIAAATFPDGEEMSVLAGIKAGDATGNTLSIDWIACAQARATS